MGRICHTCCHWTLSKTILITSSSILFDKAVKCYDYITMRTDKWKQAWYWQVKEKSDLVSLCSPQIQHAQAWNWNQACIVTDQQLTTWAMALASPSIHKILKNQNSFLAFKWTFNEVILQVQSNIYFRNHITVQLWPEWNKINWTE